jgi:prepilin-type N-terminal cleavage/methylation domain-containing protein
LAALLGHGSELDDRSQFVALRNSHWRHGSALQGPASVKLAPPHYVTGQGGYTLVEVIIAVALGALLMSALTSVLLTSWRATEIASSRVEASAQIRNFESFAPSDFAQSNVAPLTGCTAAAPCTTPINLATATYTWDGSNFLDRASGPATIHAATNVTSFRWYVDSSIVVVNLTVTVRSYSQSQTFRFYPRLNP